MPPTRTSKKRPAIQFYPGDWRKDPGVQSLDYYARGVWFELLMIMHESEQRGRLILNGHAMTDADVAKFLGLSASKTKQTLAKLLSKGVASREQKTGALICRRMLRENEISAKRAAAGASGGQAKRKQKTEAKQPSSSSSSSSTSVKKEESPPTPSPPNYDPSDLIAWLVKEYPDHRQRGPWQHALCELIDQDHAAQRPAGYTETLIRANLPRFKLSQQWRDGKIENLGKWLAPADRIFMHPPPEHEGTEPRRASTAEMLADYERLQGGKS
jgi:hypothetical protein